MTFSLAHSIAVSHRVAWTIIESSLSRLAMAPPWMQPPANRSQGSSQQERIRYTLWRLRRAYEVATEGAFPEELADHIQDLVERSKEFKQAVIVWVDFVEVLIQDAERRYGSAPGQGPLKARMVKAAVVHVILRNAKFDIPHVPRILEPTLVDIVADITIDWVVLLLNRHDAWQGTKPTRSRFARWWARIAPIFLAPFNWLVKLLERLLLFIVLRKNALSPEVEAAVVKLTKTECPDAQKFERQVV